MYKELCSYTKPNCIRLILNIKFLLPWKHPNIFKICRHLLGLIVELVRWCPYLENQRPLNFCTKNNEVLTNETASVEFWIYISIFRRKPPNCSRQTVLDRIREFIRWCLYFESETLNFLCKEFEILNMSPIFPLEQSKIRVFSFIKNIVRIF